MHNSCNLKNKIWFLLLIDSQTNIWIYIIFKTTKQTNKQTIVLTSSKKDASRKQRKEGENKDLVFYWFKFIFVWIAESFISRKKTIVRKLSYHCITLFSLLSFPELGSHFVISLSLSLIHIFTPFDPGRPRQFPSETVLLWRRWGTS